MDACCARIMKLDKTPLNTISAAWTSFIFLSVTRAPTNYTGLNHYRQKGSQLNTVLFVVRGALSLLVFFSISAWTLVVRE